MCILGVCANEFYQSKSTTRFCVANIIFFLSIRLVLLYGHSLSIPFSFILANTVVSLCSPLFRLNIISTDVRAAQNDYYVLICIIEALNFACTILVLFWSAALCSFSIIVCFHSSFIRLYLLLKFMSVFWVVCPLRFSCNLENYFICVRVFLYFLSVRAHCHTNQSEFPYDDGVESFDRLIEIAVTQKKSHSMETVFSLSYATFVHALQMCIFCPFFFIHFQFWNEPSLCCSNMIFFLISLL